jgi:hypothetical protein
MVYGQNGNTYIPDSSFGLFRSIIPVLGIGREAFEEVGQIDQRMIYQGPICSSCVSQDLPNINVHGLWLSRKGC